jgi:hypothetical protein
MLLSRTLCNADIVLYIDKFVISSMLCILQDMSSRGSPAMKKVHDFIEAEPFGALVWADMLTSTRDKPLIRCENCTKTPEEIGGNAKFMVCSKCKSKLNFFIHYCSQ